MKPGLSSDPAVPGPAGGSTLASPDGDVAIRGGAVRVLGYVAGVLVSLGAATILVRHLGIAEFGRYATVTSLIAAVGGVTEAGISLYGIREFGARTDSDRRLLMANLLGMRLALTLAGIACATGFALLVGYRQALVLGSVVTGAGLLVQVVYDVLSVPLQAQLRLGSLTIVDLIRRLVALVLIAALALLHAGLLPLLAVSFGSGVLALVLLARMVRESLTARVSFDPRSWRILFAATVPNAIAASIGAVYFYVTIIVMSLIASARQTGYFATSFRVTQVALGIPILLLTAIFPLMSRETVDDGLQSGELVGKVFAVAAICGVWMSLVMAFGASFVLHVIAGGAGHGAISVLRIQGVVLTASFVSASSALALISLRRFRALIITSSLTLLFNIGLGIALVSRLGANGGALADVVSELVAATVLTVILMQAVPRHRIRASVAPPIIIAAGLSATVLLVPIGSVGRVLGATAIYFTVLWFTGSVPAELTSAVERLSAIRASAGALLAARYRRRTR